MDLPRTRPSLASPAVGPRRTGALALWLAAASAVGALLALGLGIPWALRQADAAVAGQREELDGALRQAAGQLSVRFQSWREDTTSFLERPPGFLVTPVRYVPSVAPVPGPECRRMLRRIESDPGYLEGGDVALEGGDFTSDERALLARALVRQPVPDTRVADRVARLEQAASLDGLSPESRLLLALDLARLLPERLEGLRADLLPQAPGADDSHAGIPPGRRAFLARELLAEDDPRRDGAALRALELLDRALMADPGAGAPVVATDDGRWVAWVHAPAPGRFEVVQGPAESFFAFFSPEVAEGRFEVDPELGAAALAAPLPPWFLRLGPVGEQELARLGATTRVLWLGMAGGLALLLALVAFQSWRAVRRERLLDRQKTRFVTTVTHELKTPLATIALCAETLREHGATDPEAIPRFSRMILDETERLGQRIQQILDVAAGREPLGPEAAAFDAHGVVEAVIAEARPGAREQGVTIDLRLGEGRPRLRGSPEHLAQAVNGILENAVQFGGPGTVRVAATADDGRYVIAIADEGPGLTPDQQVQVFEPFVQLEPEMTRTVPGTGLGLTLVRQCVQALGGEVLAKDRKPRGTVFLIRLPLPTPETRP